LLFSISSLFYRAWKNFDAVVRSVWRCAVSGKRLLEWTTSSDVESLASSKSTTLFYYFLSSVESFIFGLVFLIFSTDAWARLFGILWCTFFIVGYLTSKTRKKRSFVSAQERKKLFYYAEKTWRFFENCTSSEDNFLPCDNISVTPNFSKAHRTSPTNIGLYLLSCLAACDFGFINTRFNYWDSNDKIFNSLKELGVDCICVGHDHEIFASVMHEGVRLQFGLKSSTYDSNLYKNKDGKLVRSHLAAGYPIVGGTVMELSFDGAIDNAYNYYCQNLSLETMDDEMNM
jgi:hypothetical protein